MAKKTIKKTDYVSEALLDKSNSNDDELYEHKDASSGVHGKEGEIVGDSDEQTLTNKTIDGDENTVKNISQLKDPTWAGEWQNAPNAGGHKVENAADGESKQDLATVNNVEQQAFKTALPDQAGNAGLILETDGRSAKWSNAHLKAAIVLG